MRKREWTYLFVRGEREREGGMNHLLKCMLARFSLKEEKLDVTAGAVVVAAVVEWCIKKIVFRVVVVKVVLRVVLIHVSAHRKR